jgi:ribosomal protein S18 acetylase RimI-like enzyme
MRIAPATRPDLAALADLMTESSLLQRYGVTRAGASASLLDARRSRDTILVAREGAEVLGLAWVIATRALDRTAYLRLLLVAEGRRSRGVGAALLAAAERQAHTKKCRHMLLLVTSTNRRARAFYVRAGYRFVGRLPDFARAGITEALYAKSWRRITRADG